MLVFVFLCVSSGLRNECTVDQKRKMMSMRDMNTVALTPSIPPPLRLVSAVISCVFMSFKLFKCKILPIIDAPPLSLFLITLFSSVILVKFVLLLLFYCLLLSSAPFCIQSNITKQSLCLCVARISICRIFCSFLPPWWWFIDAWSLYLSFHQALSVAERSECRVSQVNFIYRCLLMIRTKCFTERRGHKQS